MLFRLHEIVTERVQIRRNLKGTSTLKAKGRLIVGGTVLFQISAESPAIRYQCQTS